MRIALVRFVVAGVLVVGAWFSHDEATRMAQRAEAHQQIVTLRYADVDRGVDPAVAATVAYWLGQYSSVTADTADASADAHVLRTVANAAFRESQREGAGAASRDPGAAVQRLDAVLQAYASALKASPRDIEAAYNYEYVARLRDQVAKAPPAKPVKPTPPPVLAVTGDLPAGPTIHGRPGMPPPDAKMEELQMLAPMEYGDREAQPEATPGGRRERKG